MSNLRSTQYASEVVTNCHNLKYGSVAKENMFCSVYSNVKWNSKVLKSTEASKRKRSDTKTPEIVTPEIVTEAAGIDWDCIFTCPPSSISYTIFLI